MLPWLFKSCCIIIQCLWKMHCSCRHISTLTCRNAILVSISHPFYMHEFDNFCLHWKLLHRPIQYIFINLAILCHTRARTRTQLTFALEIKLSVFCTFELLVNSCRENVLCATIIHLIARQFWWQHTLFSIGDRVSIN